MRLHSTILLASFLMILDGCSNTRFLTDGQLLYTGDERVQIIVADEDVDISSVKRHLKSGTPQKPNNSLFGRRVLPPVGLWVYNYWEDDEQKKLKHWFYSRISKPPVLISDIKPEIRAQKMENEIFDQGYFQSRVWSVVDTSSRNPRKARVSYFVEVDQPYKYRQIKIDSTIESIDPFVDLDDFRNKIKSGDQFNLDKLAKVRNELSRQIQDQGYYYFNPDFIVLDADTAVGNNRLDLLVRTYGELPMAALSKYTIGSIQVFISGSSDSVTTQSDPVRYGDITIFYAGDYLMPGIIGDALFFKPGDQYSYNTYQKTITRLNNLGVFSYVRISYRESSTDSLLNLMNVRIDLTVADQINLDLEADLVMKSTGYLGPAVSAGVSHNNAFKGAEKIQVAPFGSIEWQWGPKQESQLGTFSYELGINSSLTYPRILLPGKHSGLSSLMNQETSVNLNFNILNRTAYYAMFSALASYKYNWGKRREIRHSFTPAYLNSISLLATTPAFDSVINDNIYIRKSFEEQFIFGIKYDFSFDNTYKIQVHNVYFQSGISASGNTLDLLAGIGKDASERPYEILNTVYSQHFKITTDFRYYLNGFEKTLAMRLYAGIGLPYVNSSVLPYVEQFFSGGAYSVRGFTARTLGPGSYHEEKHSYIDQSGDIKLEANLEFRFGISKILKGAVFLETGNIWLINEDENRPGSKFSFNSFYDQLAVGTGVGLRFDFNFFVLRTDLGFPLRTPYLYDNKNWLPGNRRILPERLFYFAIGYPF